MGNFERGLLSRRALISGGAVLAAGLAGCTSEPRPGSPSDTPSDAPSAGDSDPRFVGDPGPGRLYLGTSLSISTPAKARPEVGGDQMGMVRRFYRAHQLDLMEQLVRSDVAAGILPFVSFKPPGRWDAMADGREDRWLADLEERLAGLEAPVLLCVQHEPENDVDDERQTPATFRAMQERLRRRLADAPLVTTVPVLMRWTFDRRSGRDAQEWLVEGTPLQGIDVYNEWEPHGRAPWRSFAELWDPVREEVPAGPCVIPELGTANDPFDPQRAALWLREAVDVGLDTDVVGMAWFEASGVRHDDTFRLDHEGQTELRRQLERPEVVRVSEV